MKKSEIDFVDKLKCVIFVLEKQNNTTMARRKYNLVGIDGNAFSVMGYVRTAMRESGYTRTEIQEYTNDAMSSDYNHLLCVSVEMIENCNNRNKKSK